MFVTFFFLPGGYPINSLFQCQYVFIRFFWWNIFLLTIRMPMVTKFFSVVTYGEKLSSINTHDISTEWFCWVTWQKNTYLHLQKVYWHHNRQGCWYSVRGSQTWSLDQVTNMTLGDCLKNLHLHFHEVYTNKLGRLLTLGRISITKTLKSSPTSCFISW